MKRQRAHNGEDNLKEEQRGKFTLPNIKAYYKTKLCKTMQYWCKDKHRWNKIAQKQTQTFIDTIYATKWALQNNDDRVVFLINESE